jgi:hypothetical protein
MTAFSDQVRGFTMKVLGQSNEVFVGSTVEAQRAIVEGSEITGSPGQPVDTGALKGSWIPEFVDANTWEMTTNLEYAPPIEDGVGRFGPLTLRSQVGGFHSVKLLVANWDRVVAFVARQVVGGARG